MHYHENALADINDKYRKIQNLHDQLLLTLVFLNQKLKNEKAQEYLMQGVGRRLRIITRCVHNVFRIFPINQTEQLSKDNLADLDINLHAFFVNISGIFDNLAWVHIYENNLNVNRHDVGLFNSKTQKHLDGVFVTYLNDSAIKNWYSDYSKNYRDALAHRIPLYVPPAILNKDDKVEYFKLEKELRSLDISDPDYLTKYDEIIGKQKKLGNSSPFFAHSLAEGSRPVFIHGQIITDFITVEELIYKYNDCFSKQSL